MEKSLRNNVEKFIKKTYGASPECMWLEYPSFAVFRNADNKKWFAVMMNIQKSKLGIDSEEYIEIINVKCDPRFSGIFSLKKRFLSGLPYE